MARAITFVVFLATFSLVLAKFPPPSNTFINCVPSCDHPPGVVYGCRGVVENISECVNASLFFFSENLPIISCLPYYPELIECIDTLNCMIACKEKRTNETIGIISRTEIEQAFKASEMIRFYFVALLFVLLLSWFSTTVYRIPSFT